MWKCFYNNKDHDDDDNGENYGILYVSYFDLEVDFLENKEDARFSILIFQSIIIFFWTKDKFINELYLVLQRMGDTTLEIPLSKTISNIINNSERFFKEQELLKVSNQSLYYNEKIIFKIKWIKRLDVFWKIWI